MNKLKTIQRSAAILSKVTRLFVEASALREVIDYCYQDPDTFLRIIEDRDCPLSLEVEEQLGWLIRTKGRGIITPERSLLPSMMSRFGLSFESALENDPTNFRTLEQSCRGCNSVGTCWRAMRRNVPREELRSFCSNAGAFEMMAMKLAPERPMFDL